MNFKNKTMNHKLKTYIFLILFLASMMVTAQSSLIDFINTYSADKKALNTFSEESGFTTKREL